MKKLHKAAIEYAKALYIEYVDDYAEEKNDINYISTSVESDCHSFCMGAGYMEERAIEAFKRMLVDKLGHPFNARNSQYQEFIDEFKRIINE